MGRRVTADDDAPETGPLRRCVLTRERLPKERMIRFVLGPDGTIVPDLAARLPGRGIWLSAEGDVIETAHAQGRLVRAFARAARGPVSVPADLVALLQSGLARRIGESLGLARRAGQAVAGFQKAREWLLSGRAGLVIQASDGSEGERRRLFSASGVRAGGGAGDEGGVRTGAPLPAAALGRVFGRDHVVHVAVASGRLAETLANETARLASLRPGAGLNGLPANALDELKAAGTHAGQKIGRMND